MIRLTLRSLQSNIARLLLSSLAIVLGVAFAAGSMMFTDGLQKAMTEQATAQYRNTDIEVSRSPTRDAAWPADVAERIREVPGVRAAEGVSTATDIGIVAKDGRSVSGSHSVSSLPIDPALRPVEASDGRLPSAPGEIVLDERTAEREKFRVGEDIRIGNHSAAARPYRLVGLVRVTKGGVEAQGAVVGLVLSDTLELAGVDTPDKVVVAAQDGVSDAELAARIRAAVGATAQTHHELVVSAMASAVGNAKTLRNALLGFAVIAVFVAAFVIANTFTIVLAQRARETALLRLVGATRRQVFRSVVGEACVTGLLGSLLGLLVGVGLAYGLRVAFAALGSAMPSEPVLSGTTVAISFALGTGVTVLSALLPARRGTAVAPVAALSDVAVHSAHRTGRIRRTFGLLAFAGGVAALVGAATSGVVEFVIAGVLLTFTGFVLLSPSVVPAIVRVLGWPARRFGGATGAIALANAVRNPRRIAVTTNALVIGVTLVSTFTLMAESAKAPAERAADAKLVAQFLVTSGHGLSSLPDTAAEAVRQQPELRLVHPQYMIHDGDFPVYAGHPTRLGRTDPDHEGSVARFTSGTAVATKAMGIGVGGTVTVRGRQFPVVAVVSKVDELDASSRSVWLTPDDIKALTPDPALLEVHVDPAPGVSASAAKAALDRLNRDYPTMITYDRPAYVATLNASIEQGLALVTGLLALAVIIALIGVANTLTLSVLERTRENALLRAIGLTRRQLRGTMAVEAVATAVAGTVLGVAASLAITMAVIRALGRHGGTMALVLPWERLGVLLALAVLAGLAASVIPARRAARRPVVDSLAAE